MQFIFWPIGFVIAVALLSRSKITIIHKYLAAPTEPAQLTQRSTTTPANSDSLTDQKIFDEEQKQMFTDVTQKVQELFLDREVNTDGRTE